MTGFFLLSNKKDPRATEARMYDGWLEVIVRGMSSTWKTKFGRTHLSDLAITHM